uniref:Ant protein n=1 Tax=Nephromyces sp. MMRI TaxID=2496275 RepID=A0A3S8V2W9_9APIC|nr:Ant protein [Nephromyces sp. MMRI]
MNPVSGPECNDKRLALPTAFSSFMAAMCASTLLHPFDLIKTRLQVANASNQAIPQYRTSYGAVRQIISTEGTLGLYKGVAATAIASGVSWGIFRYVFDITRLTLHRSNTTPKFEFNDIPLYSNIIASVFASLFTTSIVHPLWFIKTRLELQSYESKKIGWIQYNGITDCIRKVLKVEGPRVFYSGFGPAALMSLHGAIQLTFYEELKKHSSFGTSGSYYLPFAWAAFSKLFAASMTYPLQVIRSRQQMLDSPYKKLNFYQVALIMLRNEGSASLFRGFSAHIQRACLQSGLIFTIYEFLNNF